MRAFARLGVRTLGLAGGGYAVERLGGQALDKAGRR
jgi:hypothetical protein